MCKVIRVHDVCDAMEGLFDNEEPASVLTRVHSLCDEVATGEDWLDDDVLSAIS